MKLPAAVVTVVTGDHPNCVSVSECECIERSILTDRHATQRRSIPQTDPLAGVKHGQATATNQSRFTLHRYSDQPSDVCICLSYTEMLRHVTTELLKQLHWLPVEWRIRFKLASLVYKDFNTGLSPYLTDLLQCSKSAGSTRSPRLVHVTFALTISTFHSTLKTHLFH